MPKTSASEAESRGFIEGGGAVLAKSAAAYAAGPGERE